MAWRGLRGAELVIWAIWLGAIWFMAVLVAPGLFKWLPRPEAGLVAGRLFYMLSWYSLVSSFVLVALSNTAGQFNAGLKLNLLFVLVFVLCAFELLWLHPTMTSMRQTMTQATPDMVAALRTQFDYMHMVSSVLYSIKMVAGLVWGIGRFDVKQNG